MMGDIAGTPWKHSEGDPVYARLIALAKDWAEAIVSNDATRIGSFDADEWTTDVFVYRNGRWLCVLSHITAAPTD